MKKPAKLLLGALSLTPLVGLFYIVFQMVKHFNEMAAAGGAAGPEQFAGLVEESLVVQGATFLLVLGLLGYYLWHLFVRRADEDLIMKLLWSMLLLFGSVITIPLYWLLYIWSEPRPARVTAAQEA